MKQEIGADTKSTLPFSSAIRSGEWVFVSGQGSIDPETNTIIGGDIKTQTIQTMANIRRILAAANLQLDDLVKVQVYLRDRSDYGSFNEVYRTFFNEPYPSRTVIYCELNHDLLVEIDAIGVMASPS